MTHPRVTAIVVNYNSGKFLTDLIQSLLSGSYRPDIEIVDNASSDASLELAREAYGQCENVNLTANNSNLGFAKANNQILKSDASEFFLLINPDCEIGKDAVSEFIAAMDANPDIGLAGGKLLNSDGSIQKTSKRRLPDPWSSLARTLGLRRVFPGMGRFADFDLAKTGDESDEVEQVEAISGAMMFVRATALHRVGLLDEGYFMHCEDLDWCRRFNECGYIVAYVPRATALHHKGGSGRNAKVVWHLHRGMIRFYKKYYRNEQSALFSILVYVAVYTRCIVLMAAALFRGQAKK